MRRLPDDFLLGCATAAHQVEGNLDNDWTRMEREQPERIHDGSVSGLACDHYRRYRDDLALLAGLGQDAHRFSIEWSRVELRRGEFDRDALAHYADVVRTCRTVGMEPVVTLHHFTLPTWLADLGGVSAPDAPALFARYAALCAATFGESVRWWVTINEPNVLALFGHLYGEWPPLQRSVRACRAAMRGTARMHAAAYSAIHDVARANAWPAREFGWCGRPTCPTWQAPTCTPRICPEPSCRSTGPIPPSRGGGLGRHGPLRRRRTQRAGWWV